MYSKITQRKSRDSWASAINRSASIGLFFAIVSSAFHTRHCLPVLSRVWVNLTQRAFFLLYAVTGCNKLMANALMRQPYFEANARFLGVGG